MTKKSTGEDVEPEPRPETGAQDQTDVTTEAPTAESTGDVIPEPVPTQDPEPTADPTAGAPAGAADPAGNPAGDPAADLAAAQQALVERTHDLQRLQAEYVNYKRRVDRDRDVSRNAGVESVVLDLLPVLDDLRIAREHEEMTGGFKLLVEELEKVTVKYGVESFGQKGEPFDPQVHDALMQAPMPGVTEPTVLDVMQLGYKFRGRVLRAARVAVGMPAEDAPAATPEA